MHKEEVVSGRDDTSTGTNWLGPIHNETSSNVDVSSEDVLTAAEEKYVISDSDELFMCHEEGGEEHDGKSCHRLL
jgi:hypothetical protein